MSKLLKQLKQQLEEKDKEIANLNFALRVEKNYYTNSYKQNERLKQQLAENAKYKEWMLEFLEKHNINTDSTPEYSENPIIEYCEQVKDFRECEVTELKQQIEESEEVNKKLAEHSQSVDKALDDSCDVIRNLKMQLAEKEKEIEKLKIILSMQAVQVPEEQRVNLITANCVQYNPNQTAIAVLEKLNEEFNQPYADDVYTGGQIEIIINEQIAELKGEK